VTPSYWERNSVHVNWERQAYKKGRQPEFGVRRHRCVRVHCSINEPKRYEPWPQFSPFRVYKLGYVITCDTAQLNTRQGAARSNCKPLISQQGPERTHECYYPPRAARTGFSFLRVSCCRIVHKTWIGCCRVSEDRERELSMRGISHRGESLNPSVIQIKELIFFLKITREGLKMLLFY
jgi:hypothetical protein